MKSILFLFLITTTTIGALASGNGRQLAFEKLCANITNSFTKNDCISKVNKAFWLDFDAVNSCTEITNSLLINNCLSAIENKSYFPSNVVSCNNINSYLRIDCLKNTGNILPQSKVNDLPVLRENSEQSDLASTPQVHAYCEAMSSYKKSQCLDLANKNPKIELNAFKTCLIAQRFYADLNTQVACLQIISNIHFEDSVSECEKPSLGNEYLTCLNLHMSNFR